MAGINNDLGSGGSVDLMVITKDGHTPLRNYDRLNPRKSKREYNFPRGTATPISSSQRGKTVPMMHPLRGNTKCRGHPLCDNHCGWDWLHV